MTVQKQANGRWRAKLKHGRVDVASRTFDTQREAVAWLQRERAALDGGVDPRAGREQVRQVLARWLEVRQITVARLTYLADCELLRLIPPSLMALRLSAVTGREVARTFEVLLASGLAEGSVVRYRASLSAFFAWCVREKLIAFNPVSAVRVPKSSAERVEMSPFTEDELWDARDRWARFNPHLAKVLVLLGWTGLRWSEARALVISDFVEVPTPGFMVRRSAPERAGTKSTKGRLSRRVPLADPMLPIVREFSEGKKANDLLLTTAGGSRLHRGSVLRSVSWSTTSEGRRLHDLRHTAACLWLARGVDPGTVQAWMGHESIATTNRYLHFLGTSADVAGLERLNVVRSEFSGGAGGARENG